MSRCLIVKQAKALISNNLKNHTKVSTVFYSGGESGSGAGRGGGSGGSVRDAGGSFGKREAAQENKFFLDQQREQLKKLKKHMSDQIQTHEQLIKQHEEAIQKAKAQIEDLEK
ncbi:ATPase inhibitor, mitochondrial [Halotydeus destructor]|nr:ATPase inhibitor, mitochondrial [Halotydeus destructor]